MVLETLNMLLDKLSESETNKNLNDNELRLAKLRIDDFIINPSDVVVKKTSKKYRFGVGEFDIPKKGYVWDCVTNEYFALSEFWTDERQQKWSELDLKERIAVGVEIVNSVKTENSHVVLNVTKYVIHPEILE